ncbi:hypothetical protein [Rhodoblastus sp.]|uniref:hypothetical protein n=1 Tax=Rhodoblastus sp. TaxID=1962975 RepID=UPI003F973DD9
MIFIPETGQTVVQNSDEDKTAKDKMGQRWENMPPAGPHDRPELTNYDACPGCGVLPAQKPSKGFESDPGGG